MILRLWDVLSSDFVIPSHKRRTAGVSWVSGAGASTNTFGGPNAPSMGLGGLGMPKANGLGGSGFGAGLGGFGGQRAPGTLHSPTISVNNFGAASIGGTFGRKGGAWRPNEVLYLVSLFFGSDFYL